MAVLRAYSRSGRAPQRILDSDTISAGGLVLSGAGTASVYADDNVTTLTVGGGASNTTINVGKVGNTTTFLGDVTIQGSITIQGSAANIEASNVAIDDQLIILADGASSAVDGGFAVERGATGDDAVFMYEAGANEWQIGFFDTVSGSTTPSSLTSSLGALRVATQYATLFAPQNTSTSLALQSHGVSYNLTASGVALSTTASSIIEAINEVDAAVAAATPTLQNAYNGGPNIVLAGGVGNLTISGTEAVSISPDNNLLLEASGNSIDFWDSGTRDLTITTTLGHNIDIVSDSALSMTSDFMTFTANSSATTLTSTGKQLLIQTTGGVSTTISGTGALSVTSAANSGFTYTSTFGASNSGAGDANVLLTAKTDINFNANSSGNIPLNETGQISLKSDITSTGVTSIIGAVNKSFQNRGWYQVSDTTQTSGSPTTFSAGVRTAITINEDSIISGYGPENTTYSDFVATNKVYSTALGDVINVRLSFKCVFGTNQNEVEIELDIGGAQGTIWENSRRLNRGSGQVNRITENIFVYTLSTFLANGGTIYLTFDSDADVYDISLFITKIGEAR